KAFDWDYVLMRRNLEYAVCGRIDNWKPCLDVFLAEGPYDLGAGGGIIPQRFRADRDFEPLYDIRRKSLRVRWERFLQYHSHHLPMPGDRILSRRCFLHPAPACLRARIGKHTLNRLNITQTQSLEIRQMKSANRPGRIDQRTAARISIICRIR